MKKFENFCNNLAVLSKANFEDLENEFIISGIIDKFFLQFELGWKVLKELMRYEGKSIANTGSPREIIKAAYSIYTFMDEEVWLSMLKDRNDLTHIYDGESAKRLVQTILVSYIPEFEKMREDVWGKYCDCLDEI